MTLFLYEYFSALRDHPLLDEGAAMLAAVVKDFRTLPYEVTTLPRCLPSDELEHFRRLAAAADATLVIAPETGGILEQRSRWAQDAGSRLLGSLPAGIALAADKLALAEHFARRRIPTPALLAAPTMFPLVLKPRDGAGSQATFLIERAEDLPGCLAQARRELPDSDVLFQRFAPGTPVSIAFLIGPQQRLPLAPARQDLSVDGRFHYRGGSVPLEQDLARRAVALGERAVASVPGLQGYVGVDLVLGDDAAQDVVIEINPRLTTSYLGLRRLARGNLAEAWWRVHQGEIVSPLAWSSEVIHFTVQL